MMERRCSARGCLSKDAAPQFTTALSEVKKSDKPWHRQPRWLCREHGRQAPRVSALDGKPVQIVVKSYEVKGGKLVPLPKDDQYERYRSRQEGRMK